MDLRLTLPDSPQLVFGYEYQFRQGMKSTLTWGTVNQNNLSKNIYPDAESVNEHTHIFKASLTDDWNGWDIEDRARVEFYDLSELRNDSAGYTTGPGPDVIERVNQGVQYSQSANTLRVEKQLQDW